jgi:hypothetical protein
MSTSLDTSGIVNCWFENRLGVNVGPTYWTDLDAFSRGYIEALFDSAGLAIVDHWGGGEDDCDERFAGFSDLAPSTLAAILKDCAAENAIPKEGRVMGVAGGVDREAGRDFWKWRQKGVWADGRFPPLTPYLGDDGKIYLREAK